MFRLAVAAFVVVITLGVRSRDRNRAGVEVGRPGRFVLMLAPFLQRPLQQPLGASNFHAKERSRPGGPAQPWRCRPIS